MEYFKRNIDEYKTSMDPVKNYMSQGVKFIKTYSGVDTQKAVNILKRIIKTKKPNNPIVEYKERLDNGDTVMTTTHLTDYIKDAINNKEIIVPSLTVYDHPSKKKSLHASFLAGNIKRRSKHKALAFEAYQNGDMGKYIHNDVLQKVMKIFNNSLSGAYASKSTVLYNPSQHYTLTSMTRSVASIGNAVSESVLSGNKCFYTPDAVMNYITAVIDTLDMNKVASTIIRYDLSYPTVDNVMDMILYSSRRYWKDIANEDKIKQYIKKLDKYQRAAVMYVNDLYHLKEYNNELIKSFIGDLAKRVTSPIEAPLKILGRDIEGVNNLVHHICMEDIKGLKVDYSKLIKSDPDILNILAATANNIYNVLNKYRLLIKTFFTTDILPIDIANIKECHRDVIVLSDTDSTCGSYDIWVEWYFGNKRFSPEAVGLSAAVMTINTQVVDHNIRVFSKNMNIDNSMVDLLKMKNEFLWGEFATANVSKHYYASTLIREGNVFRDPVLELKGVHLIASAGNQDIVKKAHNYMKDVLVKVGNGEKIDPKELLTNVANMERYIIKLISDGDVSVFKLDKINTPDSYKISDPSKTPYFHHMLWEAVYADKYGNPGDPSYLTVKVPTTLKSSRALNEYLDTIEDTEIKNKLSIILSENNKTALGTYRVPLTIAGDKGIPKEVLQAVDVHRVVLDNLNIFYIMLETLGVFRKINLLFSEMGY